MLRAMRTASSGMVAQQLYVDTVAHNLANINTVGYKKSRAQFEDLFYQQLSGGSGGDGTRTSAPLQIGHGTRLVSTRKVHTQGSTQATGTRWTWSSRDPASSPSSCRTHARVHA